MLFTVVIPSHRRRNLLEKLLWSLQQQTLGPQHFQVRVIATEGDEAFHINIRQFSFDGQIVSIPNDPMKGKSASAKRNYGAQIADGEWIAFTDDDCLVDKDWLREAQAIIQSQKVDFIEGAVFIPPPQKPTFTYKGIQRLSRKGGYQTCNMFYRRNEFAELGGFDPKFPYYLEDTDIAWTFLENGKKPAFAEKAIVSHPVPEPVPKKILESAWRMEKLPYLFKKHPKTFKESSMRAFPRPYLILLLLDVSTFLTIWFSPWMALGLLFTRILITFLFIIRMFWGCSTTFNEISQVFYYSLLSPLISFYSLIKGNITNRVWIFFK